MSEIDKEQKIQIEDLKKIQIEILNVFTDFCEKNNINYWLSFGTLIGAIRHKGYIPWDDDIDIAMLREDYDKLINAFNLENSRYKFYCYENNKDFLYPYGKVLDTNTILYEPDKKGNKIAVNIDVFPFDKAPEDEKRKKRMFRKNILLRKLDTIRITHNPRGNVFRKMLVHAIRLVLKIFPKDFFVKKMINNSKKYLNLKTNKIGVFDGYSVVTIEKDLVSNCIEGEFEGKKYKIPSGYDKFLKCYYGDYMKLPPKEERVPHHKFEAYFVE